MIFETILQKEKRTHTCPVLSPSSAPESGGRKMMCLKPKVSLVPFKL